MPLGPAPVYDEPEFIVRNLYRLYGGWWDGNPAHLKPARDVELASLAGGAAALAARAEATADLRLACELVELAYLAAPDDAAIAASRAAIYTARAASERSLMARGVSSPPRRSRASRRSRRRVRDRLRHAVVLPRRGVARVWIP